MSAGCEGRLDIGEVVTSQQGHRRRLFEPHRLKGLALGGIGQYHRDAQGAGSLQVPVVLVGLHHHHPPALGYEALDDSEPDRAEAHHHHVARHHGHLLAAERLFDAAADQQVGEQSEGGGHQGHPGHHEEHAVGQQPSGLPTEGVVAETDGCDGGHGEIDGIEDREMGMGLDGPVAQPDHDRGHDEQDDHGQQGAA